MKKITILIPVAEYPDKNTRNIRIFKNISKKISQFQDVKIKWVVFKKNHQSDSENVIFFDTYKNAIQILKKVNPDVILVTGWAEFQNIIFLLAGKNLKIPTCVLFIYVPSFLETQTNFSSFKKKLKLLTSKTNSDEIPILNLMFHEYKFFINTLKSLKMNFFRKAYFSILIPFSMLTSFTPSKILSYGDLNLCFVQEMKEILEKNGIKKNTISIVGNPDFDEFITAKQKISKNQEYKGLKILLCTPSAHELGYWNKKEEDNLIKDVIKEIQTKSDYTISLKINPVNTSKEEYENLASSVSNNVKIFQKEELLDLINESDIIISYSTTSIFLFSILLEKPTIFLDFYSKYKKMNFFLDENVMTKCNRKEDLIKKIEETLIRKITNESKKQYLEKHLGNVDGKSSERIAKNILELVSK